MTEPVIVRLQVLMVESMKVRASWDIVPCSLVEMLVYSETTRCYIPEDSHLGTIIIILLCIVHIMYL
jgi:hypothetical protein